MIERQIVSSNVRELKVQEYVSKVLKNLGHSHIKLQRTPLGEKIIVYASRPGLIVGRKGQNIKKLTQDLKTKFNLENPQIEISEVEQPNLDAQIVAERIASSLEKFGTQRFKGIGHRVMSDVMGSGAMGIEILISGKIPSSRAKRWRFYQGYLKKCGDIALVGVDRAYAIAQIKTGIVGIQVRIMPSGTKLPDHIELLDEPAEVIEEMKDVPEKKPTKKKPATKKSPAKKKAPAKKAEAKPAEETKTEVKAEEKTEDKVEEKTEPSAEKEKSDSEETKEESPKESKDGDDK